MIHIQKPDGTVLTWEQIQGMRMITYLNESLVNICMSGSPTVIMAEAVLPDKKNNYYWDYAGDVLRDANGGEHGYE